MPKQRTSSRVVEPERTVVTAGAQVERFDGKLRAGWIEAGHHHVVARRQREAVGLTGPTSSWATTRPRSSTSTRAGTGASGSGVGSSGPPANTRTLPRTTPVVLWGRPVPPPHADSATTTGTRATRHHAGGRCFPVATIRGRPARRPQPLGTTGGRAACRRWRRRWPSTPCRAPRRTTACSAEGPTQAAANSAWWLTAPLVSMPIMGWIDGHGQRDVGHVGRDGGEGVVAFVGGVAPTELLGVVPPRRQQERRRRSKWE